MKIDHMSRLFATFLLAAVVAVQVAAQERPTHAPDMKIGEYKQQLLAWHEARSQAARKQTEDSRKVAETAAGKTGETVAALPTSTGPSSGFADRVNDSIADFLPLFQFAVDSVSTSDDESAVTVNFNPIRGGDFGSFAVKATVAEPQPFADLLAKIPEAQRSAQSEAITSALDDFGDITYTATYGYERTPAPQTQLRELGRQWGRSYSRYAPWVTRFLEAWSESVVGTIDLQEREIGNRLSEFDEALAELDDGSSDLGNLDGLTFEQAEARLKKRNRSVEDLVKVLDADVERLARDVEQLKPLGLLPFLVDNQPQFTVTAAYRDRDDLIGRDVWTGTLALEVGRYNFNTLVRGYQRQLAAGAAQPEVATFADYAAHREEILSGQKFTFSLTWVRNEDYSKDYAFGDPEQTASLALDEGDELSGKLEWIRNATWHPITLQVDGKPKIVYPRFHLSSEYVDVDGDEARRDRWVGTATYTIPLQGGMSLPLSLVYANHGRFLGETDEQLSAHFGINFKINDGTGTSQPSS